MNTINILYGLTCLQDLTRFYVNQVLNTQNKLFKKDSNADVGWPSFFMIFVFFSDGNMVSLSCFDLVLNKAKADLYNYELKD